MSDVFYVPPFPTPPDELQALRDSGHRLGPGPSDRIKAAVAELRAGEAAYRDWLSHKDANLIEGGATLLTAVWCALLALGEEPGDMEAV